MSSSKARKRVPIFGVLGVLLCALGYFLLSDGGLHKTIRAGNLHDPAAAVIVGDGFYLPAFVPTSSSNLVVHVNMDSMCAVGCFSFEPGEWNEFQSHLRRLTLSELESRSQGWYVGGQHAWIGFSDTAERTAKAISSGARCYMISTNELPPRGFYQSRLVLEINLERGKCAFWTLPQSWASSGRPW